MYGICLTDGNGIVFLSSDIHNKKEHNLQEGKPGISFTQTHLPNSFGKIRSFLRRRDWKPKALGCFYKSPW